MKGNEENSGSLFLFGAVVGPLILLIFNYIKFGIMAQRFIIHYNVKQANPTRGPALRRPSSRPAAHAHRGPT